MFETLAIQALRARNVFAQEPEAVRLATALGDGGVVHQAGRYALSASASSSTVSSDSSARGEVSSHSTYQA